jgi:hypothetical protein
MLPCEGWDSVWRRGKRKRTTKPSIDRIGARSLRRSLRVFFVMIFFSIINGIPDPDEARSMVSEDAECGCERGRRRPSQFLRNPQGWGVAAGAFAAFLLGPVIALSQQMPTPLLQPSAPQGTPQPPVSAPQAEPLPPATAPPGATPVPPSGAVPGGGAAPAPEAAPIEQPGRVFCDQGVSFRLADPASVPAPFRGFLGIWSDAAWDVRTCAALIVENVQPDGIAMITYVYGPNGSTSHVPGGVLHGTGVIRDGVLLFQNSDGTQYAFRPLLADLQGQMTTPKGATFQAVFKKTP